MKERPILFSAPMVRAILEGRKTQTRRVVKIPGCMPRTSYPVTHPDEEIIRFGDGTFHYLSTAGLSGPYHCPYGQPGDRLWVRESILRPREVTARDLREGADTWPRCIYRADGSWYGCNDPMLSEADAEWECGDFKSRGWRGYPSIHMPRWASRITLEITDVRVERLQDITEADAAAEGVEGVDSRAHEERDHRDFNPALCGNCGGLRLYTAFSGNGGTMPDTDCRDCETHAQRFRWLWESINGAGAWAANPWVWAVSFQQVQS